MRCILLLMSLIATWPLTCHSQESLTDEGLTTSMLFNRLDCALAVGSTGIGFDLATPLSDRFRLRAGFDFMPKFNYDMYFGIQVGTEDPSKTQEENNEENYRRFEKMSGFMKDLTGYDVNNYAIMVGKPSFSNVKLLLDIYPFNNRSWRITTGFYYGSSEIADALNSMSDMHTLMGMDIYNNIYDKLENKEQLFKDYDLDPEMRKELWTRMKSYGRMSINIGQFTHDIDITDKNGKTHSYKAGDTYCMVPDANGMLWAKANANAFKPYFGAGYEGRLIPDSDRCMISCELGAMFWGGVPDIITHEGVNLCEDVTNVRGDVRHYLNIIKCLHVYPVLNLRVSINLFRQPKTSASAHW
ncbi:MAG: hypothetical protein MJY59_05500 [Bacteroidaceae bacterium]|nr:hypothetical protein [Bacteroidaceae bacterium]